MAVGSQWMNSRNSVWALVVVAGTYVFGAGFNTARAEDAALPKAEIILDRYIEVTGGKGAYEKLKSQVTHASLEVAPGMAVKIKSYQAAPDRMYVATEIPGMGSAEQGYYNDVAWEKNPVGGSRVRAGAEKALFKKMAKFNPELRWREMYKETKTVGVEDVNGKPAYKLELTPAEGKPEYNFYDKESGLLVKSSSMIEGQAGESSLEQVYADYKDVNGIKVAHRIEQKVGPQQVVMVFEKIEYNADIPADRFDYPAEIKEILAKEKDAKPADAKPAEGKP